MDTYIGFDSAWADNPKAPGAICALTMDGSRPHSFRAPVLASFSEASSFIRQCRTAGVTLVALDQPTIVPNKTGMRPVERVAASVISWMGGGVQPSNQGRKGMFCDESPIWKFLGDLEAVEDPHQARSAINGLYLMEVFPALALASLDPTAFGRKAAPKYNPDRKKTFQPTDWPRVAEAAAREADTFDCADLAAWCRQAGQIAAPRKADQDRLDAALCVLIALRWRLRPPEESLLVGDVVTGYMVSPCCPPVRARLAVAARKHAVPIHGTPD